VMVSVLGAVCKRWGLTINAQKTVVMGHFPTPITLDGATLEAVDTFRYLGSTIAANGAAATEVDARIACANQKFAQMRGLWNNRAIPLLTKTKFYRAIVIPTLTYAGETLPLTLQEEQRMNTVHMNFLRRLCHLQRLDRVRNSDILERCHCASIQD